MLLFLLIVDVGVDVPRMLDVDVPRMLAVDVLVIEVCG